MLVGRAFIRRHGRILLVQRSLDDRNNPGLWEVPGGKVDQGELLLESLMREVKEEAGLNIRPISPTLMGESYYFSNEGRYAGMLYLPLYTVFETEGEALLSFEHCNLGRSDESFRLNSGDGAHANRHGALAARLRSH